MAIWDRFKKKDQSVLPEEVKQYYQSEQRQRRGVAALLGIAALIITVLVAAGLFYGGRYAYRQINKDNNQTAQEQSQPQATPAPNEATPAETPSDSTNNATPSMPSSPETSTPPATPPAPTPAPSSSPALGDEPASAMPHTGDPGM